MATSLHTSPRQSAKRRTLGISFLAGYLLLYSGILFAMHRANGSDVSEPILALGILGIGFSAIAWLLAIGVLPLPYAIVKPKEELATIGLYYIAVIAFVTWGFGFLHKAVPAGLADATTIMIAKVLVFVALPAALFRVRFGYDFRRLAPASGSFRHVTVMLSISALLLAFQAVFGRGMHDLTEAHLSPSLLWLGVPLTFVWLSLEAGVVEEFFFRVLLQTRLSAVLKSELGAIVIASLCFGCSMLPACICGLGSRRRASHHIHHSSWQSAIRS